MCTVDKACDDFCLKITKKMTKWLATSRYFVNFLFDLGKIDLPMIIHGKFHDKIRILSAICALITRWLHF